MQTTMPNHPREVLSRWLGNKTFTADELADAMGVRPKTFYGYIEEDDRDIPVSRVVAVSHFAERTKGLTDLADVFHTPEFVSARRGASTVDGCIKDEINLLVEQAAALLTNHRAVDPDGYDRAVETLGQLHETLRAEGRLLRTP